MAERKKIYTTTVYAGYGNKYQDTYFYENGKILQTRIFYDPWEYGRTEFSDREISKEDFENYICREQKSIMKEAVEKIEKFEKILKEIS